MKIFLIILLSIGLHAGIHAQLSDFMRQNYWVFTMQSKEIAKKHVRSIEYIDSFSKYTIYYDEKGRDTLSVDTRSIYHNEYLADTASLSFGFTDKGLPYKDTMQKEYTPLGDSVKFIFTTYSYNKQRDTTMIYYNHEHRIVAIISKDKQFDTDSLGLLFRYDKRGRLALVFRASDTLGIPKKFKKKLSINGLFGPPGYSDSLVIIYNYRGQVVATKSLSINVLRAKTLYNKYWYKPNGLLRKADENGFVHNLKYTYR